MRGRPPVPRRALLAATLGAVYALLILPAPSTFLGISVFGVAWFLLAGGLLLLHPLIYHTYVFWAILYAVWRAIVHVRADFDGGVLGAMLDIALPIASAVLLLTSDYLVVAQEAQRA